MPPRSLVRVAQDLSVRVAPLSFGPPTTHVYNPLEYAWRPYEHYLKRFGRGQREIVLLGMNPGPYGMTQTGVPFGEIAAVRDWLGIHETVKQPERLHPRRPIEGFDCARSEVSGARLWGWAKARFGTPEKFFDRFMILNYCPLVFMEASGRNRTPDHLPAKERAPLFEACDLALQQSVKILKPEWVIGIGAFAEKCAQRNLADQDLRIGRILHPSPASPLANRDWAGQAERGFEELGIAL